ncbi:hypothetical protein VTO42DRAFT_6558 [Malbranchea cinnamomea]
MHDADQQDIEETETQGAAGGGRASLKKRFLQDCSIWYERTDVSRRRIWSINEGPGESPPPRLSHKYQTADNWALATNHDFEIKNAADMPPKNLLLDDVYVFLALLLVNKKERPKLWHNDFETTGKIRRTRVPCGPPVLYDVDGMDGLFIAEFNGYVLGGDVVASTRRWLISEDTRKGSITFGNVRWHEDWDIPADALIRRVALNTDGSTKPLVTEAWEGAKRIGEFYQPDGFEVVDYIELCHGDPEYFDDMTIDDQQEDNGDPTEAGDAAVPQPKTAKEKRKIGTGIARTPMGVMRKLEADGQLEDFEAKILINFLENKGVGLPQVIASSTTAQLSAIRLEASHRPWINRIRRHISETIARHHDQPVPAAPRGVQIAQPENISKEALWDVTAGSLAELVRAEAQWEVAIRRLRSIQVDTAILLQDMEKNRPWRAIERISRVGNSGAREEELLARMRVLLNDHYDARFPEGQGLD